MEEYLKSRTITVVSVPKQTRERFDDSRHDARASVNVTRARDARELCVTPRQCDPGNQKMYAAQRARQPVAPPGGRIIPPINTDIRLEDQLPRYVPTEADLRRPGKASATKRRDNLGDVTPAFLAEMGLTWLPSEEDMWSKMVSDEFIKRWLGGRAGSRENFQDGNDKKDRKFIVPPLNTDIRLEANLPRFIGETVIDHTCDRARYTHVNTDSVNFGAGGSAAGSKNHARGEPHEHDHVHESFSWVIPTKHDDAKTIRKKSLMATPLSQMACGSCWAKGVATAFSDCLVVGEAVDWAPDVSATYCMAISQQGLCEGGMPAQLCKDLERQAVSDNSCIDYSWCASEDRCNTDSSTHFQTAAPATLSRMVPNVGCYYDVDKFMYKLDRGTDTFSINTDTPIADYMKLIKYHILDFGPVCGGYLVLNNFLDGKFTQFNGGVYFDRADYGNVAADGTIPFSDSVKSSRNSAGLHLVTIVGWGVAKNIQYDNGKRGDVPFWHCRNSWGTQWGDNGYFKMAQYPYNTTAQYDKVVTVNVNGGSARIGGMVLLRATHPPEIEKVGVIYQRYLDAIKRVKNNKFYERPADPGAKRDEYRPEPAAATEEWWCSIL